MVTHLEFRRMEWRGEGHSFFRESSNLDNLLKHIMVRAKERVRVLRHEKPVVLLQGRVEERNLHHQKSRRENTRNIAFFKQEMKKIMIRFHIRIHFFLLLTLGRDFEKIRFFEKCKGIMI